MRYLIRYLGIILICIHSMNAPCQSPLSIENGLILDLDADQGIELADKNRVTKWINQVKDFQAREFLAQDTGRTSAGSGRPTLIFNNPKIGGHNSLQFKRQELVNHEEDAFDQLIKQETRYSLFL